MSENRSKTIFVQVGRFLYRYRGLIAAPFFLLLLIFSRSVQQSVINHPLLFDFAQGRLFPPSLRGRILVGGILDLIGLAIRLWAAGYIGQKSRGNKFAGEFKIINGPYRYLKHPLYLGNLFLVLGVILLFNPSFLFGIFLVILFLIEYTIIINAENSYLRNLTSIKTKFKLSNVKSEISTIIILTVIYIIYFIPSFR